MPTPKASHYMQQSCTMLAGWLAGPTMRWGACLVSLVVWLHGCCWDAWSNCPQACRGHQFPHPPRIHVVKSRHDTRSAPFAYRSNRFVGRGANALLGSEGRLLPGPRPTEPAPNLPRLCPSPGVVTRPLLAAASPTWVVEQEADQARFSEARWIGQQLEPE